MFCILVYLFSISVVGYNNFHLDINNLLAMYYLMTILPLKPSLAEVGTKYFLYSM